MSILTTPIALPLTLSSRDLPTFLTTNPKIYVWDDFESRIIAKIDPNETITITSVRYADLKKAAPDETIESELPTNHLFTEKGVCETIAFLIEKQINGKDGPLLTNSNTNLFYTKDFVVGVFWVGSGWRVDAWDRGRGGWLGGRRVFSPVTESSVALGSALGTSGPSEIDAEQAAIELLKQKGYKITKEF